MRISMSIVLVTGFMLVFSYGDLLSFPSSQNVKRDRMNYNEKEKNMKSDSVVYLKSPWLSLSVSRETGAWTLLDKRSGVEWQSNPDAARFGEITLRSGGDSVQTLPLVPDYVCREGNGIHLMFHPDSSNTNFAFIHTTETSRSFPRFL